MAPTTPQPHDGGVPASEDKLQPKINLDELRQGLLESMRQPQHPAMETNRVTLLYFCVASLQLLRHKFTECEKAQIAEFVSTNPACKFTLESESSSCFEEDESIEEDMLQPRSIANMFAGLVILCIVWEAEGEVEQTDVVAAKVPDSSETDTADDNGAGGNRTDPVPLCPVRSEISRAGIAADHLDDHGFSRRKRLTSSGMEKITPAQRRAIGQYLRRCQLEDGSFLNSISELGTDVRFSYCAAVIAELLDLWDYVDRASMKNYALSCRGISGGFGIAPWTEEHGGASFCAVACLEIVRDYEERQAVLGNERAIGHNGGRAVAGSEEGENRKSEQSCDYYSTKAINWLRARQRKAPGDEAWLHDRCEPVAGTTGKVPKSDEAATQSCISALSPTTCEERAKERRRRFAIARLAELREDNGGFEGRFDKRADCCYTFWVGGALGLLGEPIPDKENCLRFLAQCFARTGFRKSPNHPKPDLLHTWASICGLSLCGYPGVRGPLDCRLGTVVV
ncbi:unnamed protein product [Amoebophrya sp. A120]|nr:unnamed protein product [Amoebophrya sp. A120]|eukprot:GSA120T00005261001.1